MEILKNGVFFGFPIDFFEKSSILVTHFSECAPVAQLDRASASGVEGREFKSRRVHHFFVTCLNVKTSADAAFFFDNFDVFFRIRLDKMKKLIIVNVNVYILT